MSPRSSRFALAARSPNWSTWSCCCASASARATTKARQWIPARSSPAETARTSTATLTRSSWQMSDERLQRGIYLRRKERPAACYRLLVLNVTPGATGRELRDALADIAGLLAGLKAGRVPELAGL